MFCHYFITYEYTSILFKIVCSPLRTFNYQIKIGRFFDVKERSWSCMEHGNLTSKQMERIMQENLKLLRQLFGVKTIEFSKYIGIARQTLNNLEAGRVKLNTAQFIAICAVFEHLIAEGETVNGFSSKALIVDSVFNKDAIKDGKIPTLQNRKTLLERYFELVENEKGR